MEYWSVCLLRGMYAPVHVLQAIWQGLTRAPSVALSLPVRAFVVDGICPLTVRLALIPVQAGDFRKGAQRTRVRLQEARSFVRCASSSLYPPQERAVQEGECDGVDRSRCSVLLCSVLVWFGFIVSRMRLLSTHRWFARLLGRALKASRWLIGVPDSSVR